MKKFYLKFFVYSTVLFGLILPTFCRERGALRELVHKRIEAANEQLSHVNNPVVKALNRNLAQKSIVGLHPETLGFFGDLPDEMLGAPTPNLVQLEKRQNNRQFHPENARSLNFRQKPDNHFLQHQNFQPSTPAPQGYLTPFKVGTTTTTTRPRISHIEPPRPNHPPVAPYNPQQQGFNQIQVQNRPQAQVLDRPGNNNFNQQNSFQSQQEPIRYKAQIQPTPVPRVPDRVLNPSNSQQVNDNPLSGSNYQPVETQQVYPDYSQIMPDLYQQQQQQQQQLMFQRGQLEKFRQRNRDPNHPLFSQREKEKTNLMSSVNDNMQKGQRFIKAKIFKFEEDETTETPIASTKKSSTKKPRRMKTTTKSIDYEEYLVEIPKDELTSTTKSKELIYDDVSKHNHTHHDAINDLTLHRNVSNDGTTKQSSTTTTVETTTVESNRSERIKSYDSKLDELLSSNVNIDKLLDDKNFLDELIQKYGDLHDDDDDE